MSKETANNAFDSPTALTARRLRSPSRTMSHQSGASDSDRSAAGFSTRSRRSVSMIHSNEDASLFEQMSHATSVKVSTSNISKRKQASVASSSAASAVASSVDEFIKGADNATGGMILQSFSPNSKAQVDDLVRNADSAISSIMQSFSANSPQKTNSQAYFPEDDEEAYEEETGPPADVLRPREPAHGLDLKNNDNSFHVLANLMVDFFGARSNGKEIILQPDDGEQVARILPESARLNFIEAVRYRLKRTPREAHTPLQLLTLQSQQLRLDRYGSENPILVSLALEGEPVSVPLVDGVEVEEKQPSKKSLTVETGKVARNNPLEEKKSADISVAQEASEKKGKPQKRTKKQASKVEEPRDKETVVVKQATSEHKSVATSTGSQLPKQATGQSIGSAFAAVLSVARSSSASEAQSLVQSTSSDAHSKVQSISDTRSQEQGSASGTQAEARDPSPLVAAAINEPSKPKEVDKHLQVQLETRKKELEETVAKSFSFDTSLEGDLNSGENIATKQLLMEIQEATKLMEDSVTPETTEFWRDHVQDLQARLRELRSTAPTTQPALHHPPPPQPHHPPVQAPLIDIVENNRRLLSEFQQREHHDFQQQREHQYIAPVLSSSKSRDSSQSHRIHKNASQQTSDSEYESPMVDVVSPADLPAGYHFEAEIEGQRFLATVPPGGVQEGETFTCYMRELNSVAIDIPVGYWKDEPTDICKYGCWHPVFWNSFVCPLGTLSSVTLHGLFRFDTGLTGVVSFHLQSL